MAVDYAQLAQSLKDNDAFQRALDDVKADALLALSIIDPDNKNGIIRAQATASVVDAIRADLEMFIRDGREKAKPGIA